MSGGASYQSTYRNAKRAAGYKETTIWLSPEENKLLEDKAAELQVPKLDVIRIALKKAFNEEKPMG